MSFDKKDLKNTIDDAADKLKSAVDTVAAQHKHNTEKAKEAAQAAGDKIVELGEKIKEAAK
jgi:uncharacterized protein Yka (UPF0111/DUF47 family)